MNGGVTLSSLFVSQMEAGREYARLSARKRKLDYALAGIAAMHELAPHAYASISFGKQSICLAHMLYQIEPQLPMFFLASGESWIIHDFAPVIEAFLSRWPINLTVVQTDHVFNGHNLNWEASRKVGNRDLQEMCKREEWDGWYWGLAKEESVKRRITLSKKWPGQSHPTIYRYADGKYRCCPLAQWKLLDIAAYVIEHDLPLLSLYKQEGLQMRTTARVTGMMADEGGVAYLSHTDQEALNRLCARFPELRTKI